MSNMVGQMPNSTSALFAIVEHPWAKDLKQALMDPNATVFIHKILRSEMLVRIEKRSGIMIEDRSSG